MTTQEDELLAQIAALNAIGDKAEQELARDADRQARGITLEDFLTAEQIRTCLAAMGLRMLASGRLLRLEYNDKVDYTAWVLKEIIEPNMPEINRKLDELMQSRGLPPQPENDARYLAYAVTFIVEKLRRSAA